MANILTAIAVGNIIAAADLQDLFKNSSSATAPTAPQTGQLWFNSTSKMLFVWDGTAWAQSGAGSFNDLSDVDVAGKVTLESSIMWDAAAIQGGVTGQWVPNQVYDCSPTGGASNDF